MPKLKRQRKRKAGRATADRDEFFRPLRVGDLQAAAGELRTAAAQTSTWAVETGRQGEVLVTARRLVVTADGALVFENSDAPIRGFNHAEWIEFELKPPPVDGEFPEVGEAPHA